MEVMFENSSKTKQRLICRWSRSKPGGERSFGAVDGHALIRGARRSGGPFLAYRVEAEGRVIAYSADTEWTETLIPAGRDADLFIAEAYYYDKDREEPPQPEDAGGQSRRDQPEAADPHPYERRHAGAAGYAGAHRASDGMIVEFDVRPSAPALKHDGLATELALGRRQWATRTDPVVAHPADRETILLGGILSCQQLTYQRSQPLGFSRRQHIQQ